MDVPTLIHAARAVRAHAYAPYSGYAVGAAVLDEQGRTHVGCNVENVSYGLTVCAERVAVGRMVSEGGRSIRAVVVATRDGGTPCGACRQVLAEFAEAGIDVPVVCVGEQSETRTTLAALLPGAFTFEAGPS